MNPILQFPKRGRALPRSAARRGPPAQILFFTGVRYERQASASTNAEASGQRAREGAVSRRSRPRGKKSA
jgi:hypothetical protein